MKKLSILLIFIMLLSIPVSAANNKLVGQTSKISHYNTGHNNGHNKPNHGNNNQSGYASVPGHGQSSNNHSSGYYDGFYDQVTGGSNYDNYNSGNQGHGQFGTTPEQKLQKAEQLINSGQMKIAIYVLRDVIKTTPSYSRINSQAHVKLGAVYVKRRQFMQAARTFRDVATNGYSEWQDDAQFWLGYSYEMARQYGNAVRAYERYTRKFPYGPMARNAKQRKTAIIRSHSSLSNSTYNDPVFNDTYNPAPVGPAADNFKKSLQELLTQENRRIKLYREVQANPYNNRIKQNYERSVNKIESLESDLYYKLESSLVKKDGKYGKLFKFLMENQRLESVVFLKTLKKLKKLAQEKLNYGSVPYQKREILERRLELLQRSARALKKIKQNFEHGGNYDPVTPPYVEPDPIYPPHNGGGTYLLETFESYLRSYKRYLNAPSFSEEERRAKRQYNRLKKEFEAGISRGKKIFRNIKNAFEYYLNNLKAYTNASYGTDIEKITKIKYLQAKNEYENRSSRGEMVYSNIRTAFNEYVEFYAKYKNASYGSGVEKISKLRYTRAKKEFAAMKSMGKRVYTSKEEAYRVYRRYKDIYDKSSYGSINAEKSKIIYKHAKYESALSWYNYGGGSGNNHNNHGGGNSGYNNGGYNNNTGGNTANLRRNYEEALDIMRSTKNMSTYDAIPRLKKVITICTKIINKTTNSSLRSTAKRLRTRAFNSLPGYDQSEYSGSWH